MSFGRPLDGVKVLELATFVAAPCCTRFLADQGADVIKVEALAGDGIRHAGLSEGRPDLPDENITFDIENGNKKAMAMNLKDPTCFEVLMKLIAQSDVFVTNWRPKALERMGLDYDALKVKFPKLVYGSVTGYGDKGPDKDLPGYDFTAFFSRSGILGSLYEKDTTPMNLIPSMGDRQVGMFLAAGILAALFKAARTGRGDKVSASLLGTAIFTQGTMIQCAQYGQLSYPLYKRESPNPLNCSYKTKDDRFIQFCVPMYELFPKFAAALGHEEWISDPRFATIESVIAGSGPALYDAIADCIRGMNSDELSERVKKADLPFAIAQVWSEVLEDPQAWANDYFTKMEYPSGTRTLIRNPVQFEEAGLPEYIKAPRLGQHTAAIMKELGYTDDVITALLDAKQIISE